ncbi:hypothetical protein QEG73_16260 [Chitinophagaceae bacterium 26-R-25]|nr:hypothetical protein [Chitinophagaceae bacterium 26-R-25]
MKKLYLIVTCLICLTAVILGNQNFHQRQQRLSIETIKSKLIVNKTTCDSLKIYFGFPNQKKFLPHVDYYFEKIDNGLPASLSINFNDSIVNGNTTIKSFILGQPGKGKVATGGI